MNRLEELLLLWQDQSITAEEVAELKKLLATPEARAKAAEEFYLTGVVVESLRVQSAAGKDQETVPASQRSAASSISPYLFVSVSAVVLLVVLGAWHWLSGPAPEAPSAFAQVEEVQGEFFVIDNQQMRPAQMGDVLVPGQGIATEGTDSGAVVQMKDAVRLKLGSDTTVFTTIDADPPGVGGPRLVLKKGDLLVEVTRSLKRKKMSVQTDLGLAVAESEDAALHISEAAGVVVVRGEVSFVHKATGKSIRLRQGQYLAITPAGELYASQLFSGNARDWTKFPRIGLNTNSPDYAVAFSPNSKLLAAVNRPGEGSVRVGRVQGNPLAPNPSPAEERGEKGKTPPVDAEGSLRTLKGDCCVQFSPDGKWLATADVPNVRLYDLADESQVRVFPTKDRSRRIQCLAFSPDGQLLAVGRMAVTGIADVEIWDVATGTVRHAWREHSAHVTCLAFSPNGKLLASGGLDKTVILWNMETQEERARVVADPLQPVWSLAFAPRGDALAIATGPGDFRVRQPGAVALWDIDAAKFRLRFHGHSRAVTSAVFTKDGQTLITGSADTTVRFWDLKTGREYGMLKGHKAAVGFEALMVALSPDGATLATASFDQTVKLWPTTWIRIHPPPSAARLLDRFNDSPPALLALRGDAP